MIMECLRKGSHFLCFSVILIDSVLKMGKKYYPQVFLDDCKYVVKETKMIQFLYDELEINFVGSDYSGEFDEENA